NDSGLEGVHAAFFYGCFFQAAHVGHALATELKYFVYAGLGNHATKVLIRSSTGGTAEKILSGETGFKFSLNYTQTVAFHDLVHHLLREPFHVQFTNGAFGAGGGAATGSAGFIGQ